MPLALSGGMNAKRWIVASLLISCLAAPGLPAPAESETVHPLDAFARTESALCVLADASGRVIVGDLRGAWMHEGNGPADRLFSGSAVRAAIFARDGALWLATDDGLRRQAPGSGRLTTRGPALGGGRQVRDLVAAGANGVLVATAAGLFYLDRETSRPLGSSVPRGDSLSLAWSGEGAWFAAIVDERVVRIEVGVGLVVRSAEWLALPPGAGQPIDLASAPAGVFVLTERSLYLSDGQTATPHPAPLPAGADPVRVATDGERIWLATSRGLYRNSAMGWRIAGLTGSPIAAVFAANGMAWTAGPRGVARISSEVPRERPAHAGPRRRLSGPKAPPIALVHRAVVRAHGLSPAAGHRWRRRVATRGRLPEFELRLGYGGFTDRSADYDEAYTSGALRQLNDRDRDRGRDFDIAAVLRWDLGDAVYHPEEIDVAREVREWIELRDEILDEVHQLYFERLRVLAELGGLATADPTGVRLEIRAAELSAGLDAWTAGWWSQALHAAAKDSSSHPGPPENRP